MKIVEELINGKQYLIFAKREDGLYTTRLAYWFKERTTRRGVYEEGFYSNAKDNAHLYKKIICYEDIPMFTTWKLEPPVAGKKYLVYRVGGIYNSPHYTIRKYHHQHGFRSADVKYWIRISDIETNQITL